MITFQIELLKTTDCGEELLKNHMIGNTLLCPSPPFSLHLQVHGSHEYASTSSSFPHSKDFCMSVVFWTVLVTQIEC